MDPNGCEPLPAQPEIEAAPVEACEKKRTTHVCTAVVEEPLIDMSRYGTWLKLIRVTAYVFGAVKLSKAKSRSCEVELSVTRRGKQRLNVACGCRK